MSVQYACQNERRRAAVRSHSTMNGIDYLEVLDQDAPPGSPRQRTLLVYFFKSIASAGLTAQQVSIEGGVRVTTIEADWAYVGSSDWATLATTLGLSTPEVAYFSSLSNQVLVVRVSSAGDYSSYQFKVVQSPVNSQPPTNFDPILSKVDFSFKADCPSDFDCETDDTCEAEATTPPPIDYLSRDFASFRRLMLDRLSTVMPAWTERNAADLGMALVEVLAYSADHLSYYQDAVATEAYLGTARRRVSVRRHARMLDYRMHEGCNARVWVSFSVDQDGDGLVLLKDGGDGQTRPRLLTRCGSSVTMSESDYEEALETFAPKVFELMHDVALYEAHNQISFYTWEDEACCLPKGATRATLVDDAENRLRLRVGDVLIFQETLGSASGLEADANPAHRHAVRLTSVAPEATRDADGSGTRTPGDLETDPLNDQPIVEIEWDVRDALPFSLCISKVIDGETVTDMSVALGNIALADHGRTIEDEALDPDAVPDTGRYRPKLAEEEVTHGVAFDEDEAAEAPAVDALAQAPRDAVPHVSLTADGEDWVAQRDLLNSDRFAPEFVVEMEDDGRAWLRFGDDVLGRAPVAGTQFLATYRVGNGTSGNIGADALVHLVTNRVGVTAVTNPIAASGGTEPESIEEVKRDAPQAFRVQERAVTADDYAEVCERHPEVQKAIATLRWTGSWHTVFLTVDRIGGLSIDDDFELELREFLEKYRLAGHDLEIDGPRYVPLDIALSVCVETGYFAADVEQALLETFSSVDLSDGRRGFFHPDNFTFGQPVYLSQVIATAMGVAGVRWVDVSGLYHTNKFQRWGESAHDEIALGRIEIGRLEIARLDNDPNQPENGRIEFFMEGGR